MTKKQKELFKTITSFCEMCKRERIYPIGMEIAGHQKRTAQVLEKIGLIELFSGNNIRQTFAIPMQYKEVKNVIDSVATK